MEEVKGGRMGRKKDGAGKERKGEEEGKEEGRGEEEEWKR